MTWRAERVFLAIKLHIAALWRGGKRTGVASLYHANGIAEAGDRGFRDFRGMGIAGRFTADGAQAETDTDAHRAREHRERRQVNAEG